MRRGSAVTSFEAPDRGLLDAGADDRVALRRVDADQQRHLGGLDVVERAGGADIPNDLRSANDVGEWQTREQLSMLCVPIAARIRRCIT